MFYNLWKKGLFYFCFFSFLYLIHVKLRYLRPTLHRLCDPVVEVGNFIRHNDRPCDIAGSVAEGLHRPVSRFLYGIIGQQHIWGQNSHDLLGYVYLHPFKGILFVSFHRIFKLFCNEPDLLQDVFRVFSCRLGQAVKVFYPVAAFLKEVCRIFRRDRLETESAVSVGFTGYEIVFEQYFRNR